MEQNMLTLEEKFAAVAIKYADSSKKIIPFFYKKDGEDRHQLYYIWNVSDESEFDIIPASAILYGEYDSTRGEILPDECDLTSFCAYDDYDEKEIKQLHSILDQCLRNIPREFKFMHLNFADPCHYQSGSSLYIISIIEDVIDDQKPFDTSEFKRVFEEGIKRLEEERKRLPIAAHFEQKFNKHTQKNGDVYACAWTALQHSNDDVEIALKELHALYNSWEYDPDYQVDLDRIEFLKDVIKEVEAYK